MVVQAAQQRSTSTEIGDTDTASAPRAQARMAAWVVIGAYDLQRRFPWCGTVDLGGLARYIIYIMDYCSSSSKFKVLKRRERETAQKLKIKALRCAHDPRESLKSTAIMRARSLARRKTHLTLGGRGGGLKVGDEVLALVSLLDASKHHLRALFIEGEGEGGSGCEDGDQIVTTHAAKDTSKVAAWKRRTKQCGIQEWDTMLGHCDGIMDLLKNPESVKTGDT